MILIVAGIVIFLVWFYVLFARAYLIKRWPDRFGWWHTFEDKLWAGSRTIIVARLYWVGGVLLFVHDQAASFGFDWTPFVDQLSSWIPVGYRPLALSAFLLLTGIAFEWLRHMTTESVADAKMQVGGN